MLSLTELVYLYLVVESVREEEALSLPVNGVVVGTGVQAVDSEVYDPGVEVGDGVLPPLVLPTHPVHALLRPSLLVHGPDTQPPPSTAHWTGQVSLGSSTLYSPFLMLLVSTVSLRLLCGGGLRIQ